jgi:hypothetical protein
MQKYAFNNQSGLEFTDISSKDSRDYHFPNGKTLFISEPLYLNVSKTGGHRIFDAAGYCYYIQPREGWYIRWKPREGYPHFVK